MSQKIHLNSWAINYLITMTKHAFCVNMTYNDEHKDNSGVGEMKYNKVSTLSRLFSPMLDMQDWGNHDSF